MPVIITFSSSVERRLNMRASPMVRIEMGIAASIPWPTFSAEYAEATEKITQNSTPQKTARSVSSASFECCGYNRRVALAGLQRLVGVFWKMFRFLLAHRWMIPLSAMLRSPGCPCARTEADPNISWGCSRFATNHAVHHCQRKKASVQITLHADGLAH